MTDVSQKHVVSSMEPRLRIAKARGRVVISDETLELLQSKAWLQFDASSQLVELKSPKGEILQLARCAGIMAAKQTSNFLPLCHQVPLSFVGIDITLDGCFIGIESCVKAVNQPTGVEMEALVAVSVAALTIYDMLKPVQKGTILIDSIKLLSKSGGKSGSYECLTKS